jgi:hypothetical protein
MGGLCRLGKGIAEHVASAEPSAGFVATKRGAEEGTC